MRIFYIEYVYSPLYSGCAIKTSRICRQLKERGFDPAVLTIRFKGLKAFEEVDGIPVHRISSYGFTASFGRLRRATFIVNLLFFLATRFHRFDLLYTSGNDWGVFLAIGLARLCGKGAIHAFSMHGADNPGAVRSSKLGWIKLWLMKRANRFICSSSILREDAEKYGLPSDKLAWIQNGVEIKTFAPAPGGKSSLREKHGIPAGRKVLTFLGSISERKGVDVLIEVFIQLTKLHQRLYLILIGSDSVSDCPTLDEGFIRSMKAKVKENNLDESVRFTGCVSDTRLVVEYLQAADIFIFPTRMEGSPNALLEAMACGLPSVVTLLEGITDDFIKSGENGILVPREVSAFTREISGLLKDPERGRVIGAKARKTVERYHSFDAFVQKHIALYDEVITRHCHSD